MPLAGSSSRLPNFQTFLSFNMPSNYVRNESARVLLPTFTYFLNKRLPTGCLVRILTGYTPDTSRDSKSLVGPHGVDLNIYDNELVFACRTKSLRYMMRQILVEGTNLPAPTDADNESYWRLQLTPDSEDPQ